MVEDGSALVVDARGAEQLISQRGYQCNGGSILQGPRKTPELFECPRDELKAAIDLVLLAVRVRALGDWVSDMGEASRLVSSAHIFPLRLPLL